MCRTVTDTGMSSNAGGLFVAGLSVVSSGMQQILCRTMQQKHKLSSHELLSNTAPAQVRPLLQLLTSSSFAGRTSSFQAAVRPFKSFCNLVMQGS